MRCEKYYLNGLGTNALPSHINLNGFMVPVKRSKFDILGVLVRVDAVPSEGKRIVDSHGELVNNQWTEIIDMEMTQAEIIAAEISGRSDTEKLRDNKCLDLISEINTAVPALNIQINEPIVGVTARAVELSVDSNAEVSLKLLMLEKLAKGVMLPTEKHAVE